MKYHYPADYTLQEWMWLCRKNLRPHQDFEVWVRANYQSALGPNRRQGAA